MLQTTLWFIENRGLFSNHYLKNQLLMLDEWKEPNNIKEIFSKIKALYRGKQLLFPNAKESQLREDFLNPVLKYLGHYYKVEGKTEGTSRFPDYGLFFDEKSADDAVQYQGTEDFYKKAIAICEAKAWEIKLDERDPRNIEPDKRTPNSQIDDYLRWSEKKWGILTNGRFWRLYYRENSYRNYFYQVDLAEIIEKDDVKAFRYFFLFFRKEAFEVDVNNVCFLDRVYQGSVDYAKDIGKNLEENVYKAMKKLAEGFIRREENKLTKTEDDLKAVQENSMILLYRLLFMLFAEAKGLLDISKKTPASKNYAENFSVDALKKKIQKSIAGKEDIPAYQFNHWNYLLTLFDYIDKGTEASHIPKEKLHIPSYNGGLFDPDKHKFLSDDKKSGKKIGDNDIAKAIYLLTTTEGKKPEEKGFVDYSYLGIRHLGSIYEGLLEYKLKLATEPMVAVKEKGKEKWILESEFKGKKYITRVDANEIYLATDKGERKATGSYYTPEYIVKYIVENTLTPIINEKMKIAIDRNEKCSDAILSIKVLDPAMGSGHFLVEAVDFLGHHLGDAINKDIERGLINEGEYSDDWLRREILSHCIYGVDLNLMAVELAKVSLWLKTISKDKPLSFLDHRLKCGNSLIGANLRDLPIFPGKERKKEGRIYTPFIDKLLEQTSEIDRLSDDTLEEIEKKEEIFRQLKESAPYQRTKTLADARTATYFGIKVDNTPYQHLVREAYHGDKIQWADRTSKWWVREGLRKSKEKRFFHWELEFPEIFFEEGKIKENPGFDAVVGNPPYFDIQSNLDKLDKNYLKTYQVHTGSNDVMYYFYELSFSHLSAGGRFGMITSRYFQEAKFGDKLRGFLSQYNIEKIVDFGSNVKVFTSASGEEITIHTIILLAEKRKPTDTTALVKLFDWPVEMGNIKELIFWVQKKLELEFAIDKYGLTFRFLTKNISSKPWNFNPPIYDTIISKIINANLRLGNTEGETGLYDVVKSIESGMDRIEMGDTKKGVYRLTKEEVKELNIEKELLLPLVKTTHMRRYSIKPPNEFLLYITPDTDIEKYPNTKEHLIKFKKKLAERYDIKNSNLPWYSLSNLRNRKLFEKDSEKILWPMVSPHNRFCIKSKGERLSWSADVYYGVPKDKTLFNPFYILSICNSHLMEFFHGRIAKSTNWGYSYSAGYVSQYPIRKIIFKTPKRKRDEYTGQLKGLYKDYLRENKTDTILKQINLHLSAKPEESDVIHDFLNFLAQQMIDYIKEKDKEVNSFLDWLESYVRVKLDELSGRTIIEEYYNKGFSVLLGCLKKNKNKLQKNPDTPEFYTTLKDAFNWSIEKIEPLEQKVASTDTLIDQIVYKLYGLTEEEIKIVEESVRTKSKSNEESEEADV